MQDTYAMQEIATGVFIESAYEGVTVAAILTDEGVICIDIPSYPRDARDWVSRVSRLHGRGVRYLILTDYHGDRIVNTRWLSAPIIASQATADRLGSYERRYPQQLLQSLALRNPQLGRELTSGPVDQVALSFAGQITFHSGRHAINLMHKPGPNAGSIWVYWPEASILFAGDSVVAGTHPPLNELLLEPWLDSLNSLTRNRPEASLIVPGRGDPCGPEAVSSMVAYLQLISSVAQDHIASGGGKEDLAKRIPELIDHIPLHGTAPEWSEREIVAGLQRAYDQLEAASEATSSMPLVE